MRKKQYIQPQTNVVLLKTGLSMLAGSNEYRGEGPVDLNGETMTGGDGGDAASRRGYSAWDDEEEEDDW